MSAHFEGKEGDLDNILGSLFETKEFMFAEKGLRRRGCVCRGKSTAQRAPSIIPLQILLTAFSLSTGLLLLLRTLLQLNMKHYISAERIHDL